MKLIELDRVYQMYELKYRHKQISFTNYCDFIKMQGYKII
jgi:hypothetical protein